MTKNNNIGRMVYFKNGNNCFEKHSLLEIETPLKFLVIDENDELFTVLPLFYGNLDKEKDCYNELTLRAPFIDMDVPDYIKSLSVQINKQFQVEKKQLSFFDDITYDTSEIYLLCCTYRDECSDNIPELVKNIKDSMNSVVEQNNSLGIIASKMKKLLKEKKHGNVEMIDDFMKSTNIKQKNIIFNKYIKKAADDGDYKKRSVTIHTKVNETYVTGGIQIEISQKTFEPVLNIYLNVNFEDPVVIWIKFVIDDVETEDFEIGYLDSGIVKATLDRKKVPNLKEDSTISAYILGFK